jgi:hypothetical protein
MIDNFFFIIMTRVKGSVQYSKENINILLDLVEELKPIGRDHWDNVAIAYNRKALANQWAERDRDSLKTKFSNLSRSTKPTGDPHCPPEVIRAKRLQNMIENYAGGMDLGDYQDGGSAGCEIELAINQSELIALDTDVRDDARDVTSSIGSPVVASSSKRKSPFSSGKKISPFKTRKQRIDIEIDSLKQQLWQSKQDEELNSLRREMVDSRKEIRSDHLQLKGELQQLKGELQNDYRNQIQNLQNTVNMLLMRHLNGNSQ